MTHDELRESIPAYALDALSPEEVRAVEDHLQACDECRNELAALRQVSADLASGVAIVEPPAGLRERIMEQIRPQTAPAMVPRVWAVGFAAAAVAVIILSAINIVLTQRLSSLSRQFAEVALQVDGLNQRLATEEQVLVLLADSATKTVPLAGSVQARVSLVYNPQRRQGALVASDLGDPGQNLVYQLWLVAGQQPESAGTFRPVPGRLIIIPVTADFSRYQAAAISVERGPAGAPQPTTKPILLGRL